MSKKLTPGGCESETSCQGAETWVAVARFSILGEFSSGLSLTGVLVFGALPKASLAKSLTPVLGAETTLLDCPVNVCGAVAIYTASVTSCTCK